MSSLSPAPESSAGPTRSPARQREDDEIMLAQEPERPVKQMRISRESTEQPQGDKENDRKFLLLVFAGARSEASVPPAVSTFLDIPPDTPPPVSAKGHGREEEEPEHENQALEDELTCGMCAGVFIDPVVLDGCGHAFCGACVTLWIRALPPYPDTLLPGDPVPHPISCPHCRHSPIKQANSSRLARTMVQVLLKQRPQAERSANEVKEAKSVYSGAGGGVIKVGVGETHQSHSPQFPSPPPPPRAPPLSDFWRPSKNYLHQRVLSHRIVRFAETAFAGTHLRTIARANPCRDNWVEMNYLSAYLRLNANDLTLLPENIFKAILVWLSTPDALASEGVFGMMNRADIHTRLRTGMADEMQAAFLEQDQKKMCGGCADEVFCSGLFEWWMREIAKEEVKAKLPAVMKGRANCKFGRKCHRQESTTHAKKYNHVCNALPIEEARLIQQDDTVAVENGHQPTIDDSDASGTDTESDDAYVDVGVQHGEIAGGKEMYATGQAPVVPELSIPAAAIDNIVHPAPASPIPRSHSATPSFRGTSLEPNMLRTQTPPLPGSTLNVPGSGKSASKLEMYGQEMRAGEDADGDVEMIG
ncbi:hypothetical protein P7C73_g5228, partial [Tremellales sp. Uapishka_1]